MADQLSGCEADKVLDAPIKTIVECGLELLPPGPLRTLLYVIVGLCGALSPFIFRYYLGLLAQGAKPEGSIERKDYDALRASLAGGNLAARLYAKWLTAFLDGVERFFGDKARADRIGWGRTLFPHAFGLQKPAPLWTAPAFDRCLLLALIYPIVTIFLIWAISGHVGPAEAALGLKSDLWWRRGLAIAAIGVSFFAFWRFRQTPAGLISVAAFLGAFAFAFAVAGAVAGAVAFALGGAVAFADGTAFAFAGAGAFAVAFVVAFAVAFTLAGAGAFALAGAGAFALFGASVVAGLNMRAAVFGWQGRFLAVFLPVMTAACLVAAPFLAPMRTWDVGGPLLLFLGLLTLLNAPFDWASLGLTRSLLRRGLELGGWWPYLLALVDACLAAIIIACLALVMVLGVQAFDEFTAHGSGKHVLRPDALLKGIAEDPAKPEYWWAYALLLSSMIPSLINLAISGMAFTRGIPGLPRLLLLWTPEGRDVPEYKRPFVAGGLTLQMFAGAFLGIAAQGLLAWGLIFHVMPWIGLDLLDMARAVAAFDLPMQLWQIFALL
jgi:hypothetical protein